jgi:hypothetical protein
MIRNSKTNTERHKKGSMNRRTLCLEKQIQEQISKVPRMP